MFDLNETVARWRHNLTQWHRMGHPEKLAEEFAKVNADLLWRTRLMWMTAGIMGYLAFSALISVIGLMGKVVGAYSGLNGYGLGAIDVGAKLLIVGSLLWLVHVVTMRKAGNVLEWIRRRCRTRRAVITDVVFGVLVWIGASIGPRFLIYDLLRALPSEEISKLTLVYAWLGISWSVALPVLLAVLLIRLHSTVHRRTVAD